MMKANLTLLTLATLIPLSCPPKDQTESTRREVASVNDHAKVIAKEANAILILTGKDGSINEAITKEKEVAEYWKHKYQDSWFGGKTYFWSRLIIILILLYLVVAFGLRFIATKGISTIFNASRIISRTMLGVITGGVSTGERLLDNVWHRKRRILNAD